LGKSRAERPSVSEVKVRSQSFCTCTTNELTKTCNSSAGRAIAPVPLRGGQARRKTLWERSSPIGNANRQVEAMTGADAFGRQVRVFGCIPWTGNRGDKGRNIVGA